LEKIPKSLILPALVKEEKVQKGKKFKLGIIPPFKYPYLYPLSPGPPNFPHPRLTLKNGSKLKIPSP